MNGVQNVWAIISILIAFRVSYSFAHNSLKIAPNLLNLKIDEGIKFASYYTNTHFIFNSWISDTNEEDIELELQGEFELKNTKDRIRKDIEMIF